MPVDRLRGSDDMIEDGRMQRAFERAAGFMVRHPDDAGLAPVEAGEHHPDFHADAQLHEAEQAKAAGDISVTFVLNQASPLRRNLTPISVAVRLCRLASRWFDSSTNALMALSSRQIPRKFIAQCLTKRLISEREACFPPLVGTGRHVMEFRAGRSIRHASLPRAEHPISCKASVPALSGVRGNKKGSRSPLFRVLHPVMPSRPLCPRPAGTIRSCRSARCRQSPSW